MNHPIAQMLGTVLAQVETPTDMRLNPHLDESAVAETIRIAIDSLEQETGDVPKMRTALQVIARTAVDAAK